MRRKHNHTRKGLKSRRGTTFQPGTVFSSLSLPDGRTRCISSAVARNSLSEQ